MGLARELSESGDSEGRNPIFELRNSVGNQSLSVSMSCIPPWLECPADSGSFGILPDAMNRITVSVKEDTKRPTLSMDSTAYSAGGIISGFGTMYYALLNCTKHISDSAGEIIFCWRPTMILGSLLY